MTPQKTANHRLLLSLICATALCVCWLFAGFLGGRPPGGGVAVAAETEKAEENTAPASLSAAPESAAAKNLIKAMRIVAGSSREERIVFSLDGVPPPKMFLLDGDPVRLVCDFFGAQIMDDVPRDIETRGRLIQRVRTGIHETPERKIRVVVELVSGRDYEIDEYFHPKESSYELFVRPAGGSEPSEGN